MARIHSEQTIETVRTLWNEGKTATQIGMQINLRRCVVIGIVHRAKLKRSEEMNRANRRKGGQKTNERRWRDKPRKNPRPILTRKDIAAAIKPEPYLVLPDAPPLVSNLWALEENHCRWPIGDPSTPDFGYCGRERHPRFSYCVQHVVRATAQPMAPKAANDPQPRPVLEAAE